MSNLEQLYIRYRPLVYRRCCKLLVDKEWAQEATQDTFLNLLRSEKSYDNKNSAGLLYRIATNICLNYIRSRKNEIGKIAIDDLLIEIASSECLEDKFVFKNLLDSIFSKEKESTRVIAIMFFLDRMTLSEISFEVGMSVSGIRKRLRILKNNSFKFMELEDEI